MKLYAGRLPDAEEAFGSRAEERRPVCGGRTARVRKSHAPDAIFLNRCFGKRKLCVNLYTHLQKRKRI